MNFRDWFFRQLVQEGEMDQAFDWVQDAIDRLFVDQQLIGIVAGMVVSEHNPTPDLTVDISTGTAYDQAGQRLLNANNPAVVDVSEDENTAPTAVIGALNERVLSVFAEFVRNPVDPQLDGNQQTVFTNQLESIQYNVVAADEYEPPASPILPALRNDQVLLADITLAFGDTQVFNAAIDAVTRREDVFKFAGANFSSTQGDLLAVLQDISDHLNIVPPAPPDVDLKVPASVVSDAFVGSIVSALGRRVIDAAAADTRISIPVLGLIVGDIVNSLTVNLIKVDGTTANAAAVVQDDDGTASLSNPQSETGSGQQTMVLDSILDATFFPYTVIATEMLFVQVETDTIADRYVSVDVVIDGTSPSRT